MNGLLVRPHPESESAVVSTARCDSPEGRRRMLSRLIHFACSARPRTTHPGDVEDQFTQGRHP
jgi:hypothetical protein